MFYYFARVPHIDTKQPWIGENGSTPGGIPPPAYTTTGAVAYNDDGTINPFAYVDSPGLGGYGVSVMEVSAFDNSSGTDQVVGDAVFEWSAPRRAFRCLEHSIQIMDRTIIISRAKGIRLALGPLAPSGIVR